VGTNGFGDGAAAFGVWGVFDAGAFGAAAGAGEMAKVVEEKSRKSEKEKRVACFIFRMCVMRVNGGCSLFVICWICEGEGLYRVEIRGQRNDRLVKCYGCEI